MVTLPVITETNTRRKHLVRRIWHFSECCKIDDRLSKKIWPPEVKRAKEVFSFWPSLIPSLRLEQITISTINNESDGTTSQEGGRKGRFVTRTRPLESGGKRTSWWQRYVKRCYVRVTRCPKSFLHKTIPRHSFSINHFKQKWSVVCFCYEDLNILPVSRHFFWSFRVSAGLGLQDLKIFGSPSFNLRIQSEGNVH